MNERIMRIAPKSFAEFLYAFEEECAKGPDLLWLVWRYEGDFTLFDLLQQVRFGCGCSFQISGFRTCSGWCGATRGCSRCSFLDFHGCWCGYKTVHCFHFSRKTK